MRASTLGSSISGAVLTLGLMATQGCVAVNDFGEFTYGGCTDTTQDGDETDVDCGGSCGPCANGLGCAVDGDCTSGFCGSSGTCMDPACGDGAQNGNETGVDCGGSCDPCPSGSGCERNDDCASRICDGGTCAAAACDDRVFNGDESDVDCGGSCAPCRDGEMCVAPSDCVGTCDGGVCVSCSDGAQNGDETDVDCGGSCGGCALGEMCSVGADCGTMVCDGGACVSCDDGVMNGEESDVDCGGSVCAGCRHGQACVADGDCAGFDGFCDEASTCVSPGHAVLIGHDFFERDPQADLVLGNAVMLSSEPETIEILNYVQYTDLAVSGEVMNTENAITEVAAAAGRSVDITRLNIASDLGTLLTEDVDVLVIPEQEIGTQAQITSVGSSWRTLLDDFLDRGGVIIAMAFLDEGWRIMSQPGLFGIEDTLSQFSQSMEAAAPAHPIAAGFATYTGPNGTCSFVRVFGGRTVIQTASGLPVVQHMVRRPLTFAGYAEWTQDGTTQSDRQQDDLMDMACDAAFPGSRAATVDEILRARIADLPATHDSGRWLIPACPRCEGDPQALTVDGHARLCLSTGDPWPTGTWTAERTCYTSPRSTVCVL